LLAVVLLEPVVLVVGVVLVASGQAQASLFPQELLIPSPLAVVGLDLLLMLLEMLVQILCLAQ